MIVPVMHTLQTATSHVHSSLCSLVHLFRAHIGNQHHFQAIRKWSVGGVENSGNSCYINVVLQEFAHFPEVYDQILFQECCEGQTKALQDSLSKIIKNIRSGSPTDAGQISHFRSLLKENGWQEPACSRLRTVLARIFPGLFPSPMGSPFELYKHILKIFGLSSYPTVLIDDDPATLPDELYLVDKRLKETSLPEKGRGQSLCRIRLPLNHRYQFSDVVETATDRFTLRQVHYSPKKDHIATARKEGSHWLHINDSDVVPLPRPLEDSAVLLIYEREELSSAGPLPKFISPDESVEAASKVSELMDRLPTFLGLDKKLEVIGEALERAKELEEGQKLNLKELRIVEEIEGASEAIASMQAIISPEHTILKCARLAQQILRQADQELTDESKDLKGSLITYSIKEAEDYGRWSLPGILKWFSRVFFNSEVVHMGVIVSNEEGNFISDLTTEHRFRKVNVGDYIYERYSIDWKKLVKREKIEGLTRDYGEDWVSKLQNLFVAELAQIHKDKKAFSSASNNLSHVLKRLLLPQRLWKNPEKNRSLEGEMLCSTFTERLLVKALLRVEERLGESNLLNIPLGPHSSHNDLPHQMMATWSPVLIKAPKSKVLSRIVTQ